VKSELDSTESELNQSVEAVMEDKPAEAKLEEEKVEEKKPEEAKPA
jgi:hypothetical protein